MARYSHIEDYQKHQTNTKTSFYHLAMHHETRLSLSNTVDVWMYTDRFRA